MIEKPKFHINDEIMYCGIRSLGETIVCLVNSIHYAHDTWYYNGDIPEEDIIQKLN